MVPLCDVVSYVLTDGRGIVADDETLYGSALETDEWTSRDIRMMGAKASGADGYP